MRTAPTSPTRRVAYEEVLAALQRRLDGRAAPADVAAIGDGTDDELLLRLACTAAALACGRSMRLAVAKELRAPPEVLRRLADDDFDQVRIAVAGHPSTPADVLRRLADDPATQMAVAGNPSVPGTALERLARHWSLEVRRRAAANPSAPPALRRGVPGPVLPPEVYLG